MYIFIVHRCLKGRYGIAFVTIPGTGGRVMRPLPSDTGDRDFHAQVKAPKEDDFIY
jgi:hypothetical protein